MADKRPGMSMSDNTGCQRAGPAPVARIPNPQSRNLKRRKADRLPRRVPAGCWSVDPVAAKLSGLAHKRSVTVAAVDAVGGHLACLRPLGTFGRTGRGFIEDQWRRRKRDVRCCSAPSAMQRKLRCGA
jgi:hypothetical protein